MNGKVKWFNHEKGFGFITCDDGQDAFVHIKAVDADSGDLTEGRRVTFDR